MPKLWSRCRDLAWKSVWISTTGRKIRLNFGEDLFFLLEITCFWAEKAFEFPILAKKSVSISVKTFFFLFFFRDHLLFGWKSVWISEFSKKFRLNFWINRVILIQEQWKFGSKSFAVFSLFKKSPPPPVSNPGYAPDWEILKKHETLGSKQIIN